MGVFNSTVGGFTSVAVLFAIVGLYLSARPLSTVNRNHGLRSTSLINYQQLSSRATEQPPAPVQARSLAALSTVLPNLEAVSFDLPCNAYYVNVGYSVGRRRVMERTFGRLWGSRLHRVPGVDGANRTQVMEMTGNGEVGRAVWERYSRKDTHQGEIGCILSHLRAIKTAYLAGDEVALMMEDDVGAYYMPYWSFGIDDVISILNGTTWDTVQLSYTVGPRLPKLGGGPHHELLGSHLLKTPFQFGTVAYLISRRGMEKVMDKLFTGRGEESLAVPPVEGDHLQVDQQGYFLSLMTHNYITVPAMFVTHAKGSTVEGGGQKGKDLRDSQHVKSNSELWAQWPPELQREYFPDLAQKEG